MAVGPAVLIAATAVSAVSSLAQGQAQANAAKFRAAQAQRNAVIAQQQADADAQAQQRSATQAIGRARAAYGASGVTAEGSPTDVLQSSASLAELDRQNILYKGKLRAIGYTDEANIDTYSASNYLMQGMLGAGAAIAGGAAKAYGAGYIGDPSTSSTINWNGPRVDTSANSYSGYE